MSGLPRLAVVCMLSDHAWTFVPALVWVIVPSAFDGHGHDAGVYATAIGFAVPMLLAHVPVIIPVVVRREVPYHGTMWVPFVFLQVFLLPRLFAGTCEVAYPRCLGGTLGVVGMLPLIVTTLTVTTCWARANAREAR